MKRKMHEITTDIMTLQLGLDFSDENRALQMESLINELYDKEDGIYWFYKENEKKVELVKEHIEKCNNIMKMLKRDNEYIKHSVIEKHKSVGSLPKHSVFNPIKMRESNGAVDIYDESKIPDEYYITVTSSRLDKKRILKELKEGQTVPGATLVTKPWVSGLK